MGLVAKCRIGYFDLFPVFCCQQAAFRTTASGALHTRKSWPAVVRHTWISWQLLYLRQAIDRNNPWHTLFSAHWMKLVTVVHWSWLVLFRWKSLLVCPIPFPEPPFQFLLVFQWEVQSSTVVAGSILVTKFILKGPDFLSGSLLWPFLSQCGYWL